MEYIIQDAGFKAIQHSALILLFLTDDSVNFIAACAQQAGHFRHIAIDAFHNLFDNPQFGPAGGFPQIHRQVGHGRE